MIETDTKLSEEEKVVEEKDNDRLLYLSDGVFAIVITLLILEIKVPHPHVEQNIPLWKALRGFLPIWPSLFGYVLSFVTVGIMWMNHCVLFRYIKRNDHVLTILNSFLLLVVAFIPFATAVLAEYLPLPAPYPQAAVLIYSGTNVLMAIAFNLVWRHASRDNHLLDTTLDPRLFEFVTKRYRFGPLIYLICFGLSFLNVALTLTAITFLALLYALPYGDEARAIRARLQRFGSKSARS